MGSIRKSELARKNCNFENQGLNSSKTLMPDLCSIIHLRNMITESKVVDLMSQSFRPIDQK